MTTGIERSSATIEIINVTFSKTPSFEYLYQIAIRVKATAIHRMQMAKLANFSRFFRVSIGKASFVSESI